MPDNVAPMLDDVPEPEDTGDDREADLVERDEGAHEEKAQPDAELRPGDDESAPGTDAVDEEDVGRA